MQDKYGFIKLNAVEFYDWIKILSLRRTILRIQQHHTYVPGYLHFRGSNHYNLQKSMRDYHVHTNGWQDIGQHFSIFPDGEILTGRSLELTPACIYGNNAHAICIENVGNFDKGKDVITTEQKEAIIEVTALLCNKFSLEPDENTIVYHHWFNLSTGVRNNGSGGNKSCPGTNFFGGNKVEDFNHQFKPLVLARLQNIRPNPAIEVIKYVVVTATRLRIRTGPGTNNPLYRGDDAALFGAVLRVYDVTNGWYKISNSNNKWVSGHFTYDVAKAVVTASTLNVRSGPGTDFPRIGAVHRGEEVFLEDKYTSWRKFTMEEKWVSEDFLDIT